MESFDHGSSLFRFAILLISGSLFVAAGIRDLFWILLLIIHQAIHHIIIGFGTGFSASFISAVLVKLLVMFQTEFAILF